MNDLKPSKEQLEKVYGGMMTAVNELRLQIDSKKNLSSVDHQGKTFSSNELRLQIDSKKALSSIDCQGKSFNSNIAKDQAQNVAFWPLDDIELVDRTTTNKFARL